MVVITKLIGGLGNQMFQYAAGRHLALKNDTTLKLDISGFSEYKLRSYDLSHFNIQEDIATSEDLSRVFLPSDNHAHKIKKYLEAKYTGVPHIRYIKEPNFNFSTGIPTLGDNVYLDGYWQSEKYFSDIKNIITKEFTLKNSLDSINKSILEEIQCCESVSIHVRRGDYISNPIAAQVHGFLGLEYYQKALDIIVKSTDQPHFFVFSDAPQWTEKHIRIDAPITCIKHNDTRSYEDLRLMSACKHHIVANSSFSWWGAWLSLEGKKIVIAPRRWFKSDKLDARDLIPETWYKI